MRQLADRVGVMSHGHMVEESTPHELGGRDVAGTVISCRLPAQLRGSEPPAGPWDQPAGPAGEFTVHTDEPTRVLLDLGQVRYQLMLLLRSSLGFFLSIVFPPLLVCLEVITPSHPVGGLPYAQWVTPAMCAFCLPNALPAQRLLRDGRQQPWCWPARRARSSACAATPLPAGAAPPWRYRGTRPDNSRHLVTAR